MKMVFLQLYAGNIHFNFNNVGVYAIDGCTQGLIEHEVLDDTRLEDEQSTITGATQDWL
jgi:hypothetical protein